MTPTIHEINTVHKEKVIKLKCLIDKQYFKCWLEVVLSHIGSRRGLFIENIFASC